MKTPETNNPIKIMQFHRRRGGSAVFWFSKYFLLSLMLAGGGGLATSRAEIRIWTGAVNGYWSEPGNWIPAGPAGPGDLLQFRRDDDAHRSMTNDIVGLTVALQFGLDENDHDYQLDGNAIRLYENHGIEISPDGSSTITINCPLIIFQEDTSFYLWTYGGFIFDQSAKLYLNGPIIFEGGSLSLRPNSADSVTGPDGSSHIYVSGPISGPGTVLTHTRDNSTVRFSGSLNNTFSGGLFVTSEDSSRTIFDKGAGYVVTNLLVVSNASARVQTTQPNQLGPNTVLRVTDGGMFELIGEDLTIGSLLLSNRYAGQDPLVVDTTSTKISLRGPIVSWTPTNGDAPIIQGKIDLISGDHQFNVRGPNYEGLRLEAEILGAGGFTKTGDAALLLLASNSFSGSVIAAEGIIDVRHSYAFGSTSGGTTLEAGTIILRNVAIPGEPLIAAGFATGGELPGSVLTSVGSNSWSGPVTLNTNLVVAAGDMTFTGTISGTGGLGCFSAGTMRLGGTLANPFTGTLLVRCPLMEFAKPSGVQVCAGPLIVGGGAGGAIEARWLNSYQNLYANVTLYDNGTLNLNNFFEDLGPLTFNGGTITTGTGELGLYGLVTVNSNSSPATVLGKVGLPSGYREFRVADGSANPDLQINAVVLGAGNVQKTGNGQMVLAGANTYAGLTLLEAGSLIAQHATALGGTGASTIVLDGATLAFQSVPGPVGEGISLRGAGVGGTSGALNVTGTTLFRNASPSIFAALDLTTNATIRVESGGRLTTDGFVNGIGPLVKTGAGSLVFSNANPNTYTGDTLIQEGTLELRKPANVISVPGNLILGPASAGSPATARWFQTGGVNASSNMTVNANSLLDLNGNNQNVNQLNLNDGGDVQTGAGKMTFLNGGPITVSSLNPGGSQASSSFSGSIGLPANSTLSLVVGQYAVGTVSVTDPELVVSAAIPVPVENTNFERAGLFKSGGGGLRLTGNNGFNGRVDISAGGIIVGNATALGTTFDATYVTGGASLALINGITVSGETLSLNSTNSAALNNLGGDNTWTGPITLARASNIGVNTAWSLLLSGAISGSGSLTKVGAGTLTLSGGVNNTHLGNTFVNQGTLALNKIFGFQAVPASLVVGQSGGGPAALVRHLNHDQVFQHITVNPSGLLDLNNFDEYANDLTLNGGGDAQTGTGSLYVLGANGLTVNPGNNNPASISGRLGFDAGSRTINVAAGTTTSEAHDLDISAVIFQANPTVNLTKTGAGRARLGGTNTYTGTTTVSGGQLQIDGSQPQSPVLVNGARLQGSGVIGSVTFNGSAANRVAPGTTAGILTTSNFNANAVGGGALEMELNGAVAGNSYDQLNVRGSVNLTGLSLLSTLNYTSTATQQYTLINNDGTDAIIGTFTGLAQNKKFYLGGELFQVSYTGGTGNDVVLTRLVTPPSPTLTIERVTPASVRLVWATNDPPFSLQSNPNFTGTNWIAASPLPSLVFTNYIVTNTITDAAKYYRLSSP